MTIAEIQAAVAARYGVTVAELRSPVRERRLAYPRHVAMFLAHQAGKSQAQIGQAFGRAQQSVCHGVRRGAALVEAGL